MSPGGEEHQRKSRAGFVLFQVPILRCAPELHLGRPIVCGRSDLGHPPGSGCLSCSSTRRPRSLNEVGISFIVSQV